MNNLDLYKLAEKKNIIVNSAKLPKNKSVSVRIGGRDFIAIDDAAMDNSADERTHLGHELGHCETGAFYAIGAGRIQRQKAEARATRWAVLQLTPKAEFEQQLKKGLAKWELAEYFNVKEEFIETAYRLYYECGIPA